MDRRKLIIAAVVIVVLLAAAFIFFDTNFINKTAQTAQQASASQTQEASLPALSGDTANGTGEGNNSGTVGETTAQLSAEAAGSEILKNIEKVDISNNTPEYDLSLELCEDSDNRTFIRLQYYRNGSTEQYELDEGDIPELAGIFESRAQKGGGTSGSNDGSTSEGYRIGQALLNPVHSQLYLLIQGAPLEKYTQSSFYLVNLIDVSIKKLFSYPGAYGKMGFNKDFSLLAWSFGDPPVMSMHQEDSLVEVFDCSAGDYIVKGNLYSNSKMLGSNSSPDTLYDYEFKGWQSRDILKLKQSVRPLSDPDSKPASSDVLYDVRKNLLLNLDGSEWKMPTLKGDPAQTEDKPGSGTKATTDGAAGMEGGSQEQKAESGPLKALTSFYSYLGSENDYSKAMKLLDVNFRLRLQMLKQFGADEIGKNDIDAENASLYSDILKTAKFDTLIKESTKGNTSTITYFQILGADGTVQVRQQMSAKLEKTDSTWKILLIEDGLQ